MRIIATIENSYSTGSVTATNGIAGGLVGSNGIGIESWIQDMQTSDPQTYADICSKMPTFCQTKNGNITNSYSIGAVIGTTKGGLIGLNNAGNITASFYNSTINSSEMSDLSYGKTTAQMQKISTYTTNGANWTITLDDTKSKIYPYLVYNAETGTSSWTIGKYATTLNYTLGSKETTYNGLDQSLSSLWTNSIFGDAGSSLVAGTDYKFVYNNTDTVSFKNAGTYNGITIELLNADYEFDSSGTNTDGSLTISKANATVKANSDTSKVYNGQIQSVNGFSATGLVNGETISVLDGVSGASASGTNAGEYVTTLSGTDENYNLTFENGKLIISKATLIVTANDDSMVEGSRVYSGGNGVKYNGLQGNDSENDVNSGLVYEGTSQGVKNTGDYTIVPNGLKPNNYNIEYINGKLVVTPDTTKIVSQVVITDPLNIITTPTTVIVNTTPTTTIINDIINQGTTVDLLTTNTSTTTPVTASTTPVKLKDTGVSVIQLKQEGYTAITLKEEGFAAKELKDAGYSLNDLKNAGFTASELKDAGFTALQLKKVGL